MDSAQFEVAIAKARTAREILEIFLLYAVNALGGVAGTLLRRHQGAEQEFEVLVQDRQTIPPDVWKDLRLDRMGVIVALPSSELPSDAQRQALEAVSEFVSMALQVHNVREVHALLMEIQKTYRRHTRANRCSNRSCYISCAR